MREDEAGRARVPWGSTPIVARLTRAGAHLSGAILLAAGLANTLAARSNGKDDDKRDEENGKNRRDRDREDRKDRDQDDSGEARRDDRRARREDREVEREQSDRDRKNNDAEDAADSDVGAEQSNQDNRNRDDEPEDDGGGGNNAGSAAFDSPLATKARRRARDFDNRDRDEEEEDGVFVDVDPKGESIYQTDSISFATGPEGIEILTGNIAYIAAPTPTPTPLPRLELPERDGYPFGEDFPFGVARPELTPTASPTEPGDEPPDPGDVPPTRTERSPTEPLPSDVDGGDNGMEFTS